MQELVKLLNESPLFRGIKRDALEKIAQSCRKLAFGPQETMAKARDAAPGAYILASGLVEVVYEAGPGAPRDVLATLTGPEYSKSQKADLFGEMALLSAVPWQASFHTVEQTSAWLIPRDGLAPLLAADPALHAALATNIAKILHQRLRPKGSQGPSRA